MKVAFRTALLLCSLLVIVACTTTLAPPAAQPAADTESVPVTPTAEAETAGPTAEAETTTPTAQAESTGPTTFVGGLPGDIVSLDPHKAVDIAASTVGPLIYEGLIAIGPDGEWKGVLAESWQVSDDGLTWDFKLRPNVVFHNGRALEADDVVFSLERIMNEATGASMYSLLAEKIESVEAIDPQTVRITLTGGAGTFLSELGLGVRAAIIPEESLEADGSIKTPTGTGPFQFASWDPGVAWTAVRFEQYWGQVPTLSELRFVPVEEDAARLVALQSGQIDWMRYAPFDQLEALQADPDLTVHLLAQNHTLRLNFNATRPPFDDPRVRQAVAYALNKEEINQALFFGYGQVHNQPFAPDTALYLDVPDPYTPPDIEQARALLQEAGLEDGVEVTVIHPQGIFPGFWEVIASQLAPLNIQLDVQYMDIPQFVERAQGLDFDMNANEQSNIFHWDRVFNYFEQSSSSNWLVGGYHRDDIAALLEEGRNQSDLEDAKEIYAQVLTHLQDDAAAVFLLALPDVQITDRTLAGFEPNPQNGALVWPGGGLHYAHFEP